VSFDIQAGYRHFRLTPQMRDWLLFRYDKRFYRCIALQFGWGWSPMWFTQLMVPMVRKLREQYRVLAYLDDFLICSVKAGSVASVRDCRKATQVIDKLLSSLGLTRHSTKGGWVGMGWEYSSGTPWQRDRLGSHAYLHSAAKCSWYSAGYPPASTEREAVGIEEQVTIVLWCVHLIVNTNAL
jgi:Reverse transcriptase (RNA-dependent DNA polymerase)